MSAPLIDLPAVASYRLVAAECTAAFTATAFFGRATVRGRIAVRTGWVTVVDGRAKVVAELTTGTVDTGNRRRDKDLRSAKFLDVPARPTLTFEAGLDGGALHGSLRLGDRSTPITLAITAVEQGTAQVVVTATGELDRTALGVGPRGSFVGKRVPVEITAVLSGKPGADDRAPGSS